MVCNTAQRFTGLVSLNVVQGRHRSSGDFLRMENEARRPETDRKMLGCAASQILGSFRLTLREFVTIALKAEEHNVRYRVEGTQ